MRFRRLLAVCICVALSVGMACADTLQDGAFAIDFDESDRAVAEQTLGWLLEAEQEFSPTLPLGPERVRVRIASNMNEFLGLSGTYAHVGVSGVTRASESHIALKSPRLRGVEDDYRGTVRHELVHVLLHRNTNTQNLPRWLNEGICMMLANEMRWESSLQVARMYLSGQLMEPAQLERAFTMPGNDHQFGNAYAQALSMTRHLRDELGEETFWTVIGAMKSESFGGALVSETQLTGQTFWAGYESSLWGLTLISLLRTGSFWGAISGLCVLAFLVRQWRNRAILRRWESEEETDEEVRLRLGPGAGRCRGMEAIASAFANLLR